MLTKLPVKYCLTKAVSCAVVRYLVDILHALLANEFTLNVFVLKDLSPVPALSGQVVYCSCDIAATRV